MQMSSCIPKGNILSDDPCEKMSRNCCIIDRSGRLLFQFFVKLRLHQLRMSEHNFATKR